MIPTCVLIIYYKNINGCKCLYVCRGHDTIIVEEKKREKKDDVKMDLDLETNKLTILGNVRSHGKRTVFF